MAGHYPYMGTVEKHVTRRVACTLPSSLYFFSCHFALGSSLHQQIHWRWIFGPFRVGLGTSNRDSSSAMWCTFPDFLVNLKPHSHSALYHPVAGGTGKVLGRILGGAPNVACSWEDPQTKRNLWVHQFMISSLLFFHWIPLATSYGIDLVL